MNWAVRRKFPATLMSLHSTLEQADEFCQKLRREYQTSNYYVEPYKEN